MTVFHARTTTGRLNLACRSDVNFGVSGSGKISSVLWNNVPVFFVLANSDNSTSFPHITEDSYKSALLDVASWIFLFV